MTEEKDKKVAEEIMQDMLNFFKKVREKADALNEFYNDFFNKKETPKEQKS